MKTSIRKIFAGISSACVLASALPISPLFQTSAASSVFTAGDADESGDVTIDDVVKILCHVADSANNTISEQGHDNADVYQRGDGLSVNDAVSVQKYLALIIDSLPESYTEPISEPSYIHLKTSYITTEGDNLVVNDKTVTITASGTYYVDGDMTDGQIIVDTPAEDINDVEIILTDVSMTSSTAPCIYSTAASGADKTKITVNGVNTLTDTSAAAYTESGVIYANNKLTITKNSTGTLNINSSMNAGINSEKKINLNGGIINVNTADLTTDAVLAGDADAIKSDKDIEIEGSVINIDSSADGIKSDAGVYIMSGDVGVKAGNDAVQAATEISVSGGNVAACGDRGFRLDVNGLLNITGGTVIATATDYQVNGNEVIDMSGSTQTMMLLDMEAEWKKSNALTIGDKTYEPLKKYNYVLISDSSLASNGNYNVYIAGQQACHSTDADGNFANSGIATQYYAVKVKDGGEVVVGDNVVKTIAFSDSSVSLLNASGGTVDVNSAENVSVTDNTYVTIEKAGDYEVSGSCANGQVKVSTDDTLEAAAYVTLSLNGLTLSNSNVAPIYVENVGDECAISAKNGTVSTISDGTSHTDTYVNSDNETITINSAIFARDDLKLKGNGTLIVNGNTEDGIVCKNDLKIWNGTINVTAVDDGIRGNSSVRIGDPANVDFSALNVTVKTTASGDGIKSNSTETGKGYVTISGGTVNIDSYADGIQAEQEFTMDGGDLTIHTYQGSEYTGSGSSGGSTGGWGGPGMGDGNSNKVDISAKGIKAVGLYDAAGTTYQSGGNLNINGGTINIDSSDDCLHSAGNLNLFGGNLTLASADDGCHSDSTLTIGNGSADTFDDIKIYISKCYEGIEGMNITQNSGSVIVNSTDDGYNAAGGADGSGNTSVGPWGQGGMGGSSGNYSLNLNGGLALVNATDGDHDGFDSNGSLTISGGYAISNGNEPFDSDGNKSYTGGVYVINKGSGGMGGMGGSELPSTVTASASISAGTRITLANGNDVIVSFIANKAVTNLTAGCNSYSSAKFYTGGTVNGEATIEGGTQAIYTSGTLSNGSSL